MSAHHKANPNAKSCVDKKAARLAVGFQVTAYTATKGPCIEVPCKLINSICPNTAISYRQLAAQTLI